MQASTVTFVGLGLLVAVASKKILDFYGVGVDTYGTYAAFYFFLLLSMLVLPAE
jgi:hypothetical protein